MTNEADVSTARLALAGVRVVSIALNLPGPVCARRLADFGAGVTKVEPPAARGGDPLALYAADYYHELHAGIAKRTLDLKSDAGRAEFETLLANADLLLTAQREAALARLGLDWTSLSARHPRLCQVAIVGDTGIGGEDDEKAGHDLTYVAEAGLATPPHPPATLLADLAGAERAVSAALALLYQRDRTGRGARALVSLADAARAMAGPRRHGLTAPGGLLAGAHPGYNFYRARDGWIALAALEPHFAQRVQDASGVAFNADTLQGFFAGASTRHWADWARHHDIPLAVLPQSTLPTEN